MIASLHIQTKLRDGITYLKESYFTPPFKIADIREDKNDCTLQLILMSSSPGVLDGDEYRVRIELEAGCSLRLSTQSYQRLFSMKGKASQQLEVNMAEGASFCYIPHPTVPHQDSYYSSKNKIYIAEGCRLIWGEVLTCGRQLHGEYFVFSKYHNVTEIYLKGKLIIKENLMIQPSLIDVNAMGQLENYTHQASLIYLSEGFDLRLLKQHLSDYLSAQLQVDYGVTETPHKGLLIRILGYKAEQLFNILNKAADIINLNKQGLNTYVQ